MGNETKKEEEIPQGANETPETVRAKKLGFLLGSISAMGVAIAELSKIRKDMQDMADDYEKGKDPFQLIVPKKGGRA